MAKLIYSKKEAIEIIKKFNTANKDLEELDIDIEVETITKTVPIISPISPLWDKVYCARCNKYYDKYSYHYCNPIYTTGITSVGTSQPTVRISTMTGVYEK